MESVNYQKYVNGETNSVDQIMELDLYRQARVLQAVFQRLGVDKGLSHYVRTEKTYREAATAQGKRLHRFNP